jgi:hypothetical protein
MAKKLKDLGVKEVNQAQGRILFFLWQNDGVPIQEVSRLTAWKNPPSPACWIA